MQPKPCADTLSPCVPSFLCSILSLRFFRFRVIRQAIKKDRGALPLYNPDLFYFQSFIPVSMLEMAHTGKDHGKVVGIGGLNHLVIADGAAGLNNGSHSSLGSSKQAVSKGEKGI